MPVTKNIEFCFGFILKEKIKGECGQDDEKI